MSKLNFTVDMQDAMSRAGQYAFSHQHEFITPEHVLYGLLHHDDFCDAIVAVNETVDIEELIRLTEEVIAKNAITSDEDNYSSCQASYQLVQLLTQCAQHMEQSHCDRVTVPIMTHEILHLKDSWANNILRTSVNGDAGPLIREVSLHYANELFASAQDEEEAYQRPGERGDGWKSMVMCINEQLANHNPLIGRIKELDRAIQVLLRKEKNNPLFLGEPGVGKTALIYGLAQRIEDGQVPKKLKDYKIYQLDMGALLAGSQFRGDMERRIQTVLEGMIQEGNCMLFIDDIHNAVGAGQGGDGGADMLSLLKTYLDGGAVRVLGATTYEDYNRQLSKRKAVLRSFQNVDVPEPSITEAKYILQQLKPIYEKFHKVKFEGEIIDYVVDMTAKHINDRFLPDKAIDLIDEVGAMAEAYDRAYRKITKNDVAAVLAKVSKVDALAIKQNDGAVLSSLTKRMQSVIFGQDKAISTVVEAVQMAKAGLSDENKPLASLLFVGPTGVGKTEVAKTLAKELGVQLVRFDMSEYVEKHTVAKLIGSPAGYVGYDDGGLLTEAVRKNPDCVLLLDEIEKAHEDIFNILLQVMDYGVLTDNKGRKAHFKNVVLIMTSNAGAQHASKAALGFASTATAGSAMLKQVKQTFKPEFINRLSDIVVFNDMDREMAQLILKKKVNELREKLKAKNVTLTIDAVAREYLLNAGFSKAYGAREMDRVLQQQVKTLLMREILFGSLTEGGKARLVLRDNTLALKIAK